MLARPQSRTLVHAVAEFYASGYDYLLGTWATMKARLVWIYCLFSSTAVNHLYSIWNRELIAPPMTS